MNSIFIIEFSNSENDEISKEESIEWFLMLESISTDRKLLDLRVDALNESSRRKYRVAEFVRKEN